MRRGEVGDDPAAAGAPRVGRRCGGRGPDGGEGRRGAEVTGVGAAGAAGDEGRTRGTGIGRGPIRIGARGRKGIGGRSGCG